jgi:alpha-L-arabinofuranosidase
LSLANQIPLNSLTAKVDVMRNRHAKQVLAILISVVCAIAFVFPTARSFAQTAKLTVQADQPGPKVSPMLYGTFFEEINCAGDGGLYAELIRNRSFEDTDKPDHWSLIADGTAKGEIGIDEKLPMSPKNPRSLKLTIAAGGKGRVGVGNDGYWGIAVQKDAAYELSFSARAAAGFSGPLTVTLESSDGKAVYAQAEINGLTEGWKTFKASLVSTGTNPKARLTICANQPGTVWLDMVSLFPKKTWKDRPNGLRPDLAEMLNGLKPSFIRFPGGCWVEGETMKTAQRWKTTIGDLSERGTLWNLWQYYSTNGLGYHEYLQMCEDMGAEPLFVVNCGMSHKEVVPMDKMGEFVQDALDAIAYANDPADTQWGVLRAKAGHTAPFNLKYLEIGNENGGAAYSERYRLIYEAIKRKYPQMNLIADDWGGKPDSRVDILDEHYYNTPEFFIANANHYDNYDRKGPKIYVGEYAVTQGCGQGNLRGAIGEAAFMTGMERNSDVVVMASYAPLFANINYKKWNPDLINFDSSRVYGLPSYYVQKMFSENRGDVVLPVSIEMSPVKPDPIRGMIGLGTWATKAEFKDVKVVQGDKVLYQSDFAKSIKDWNSLRGKWELKEGALRQSDNGENCRILVGDPNWSDYTLSVKARKLGGAEGFLILFGVRDQNDKNWWNIGGWGNSRHGIEMNGIAGERVDVPARIETDRWYDIRVELAGPRVRCYLDGKLIQEASLKAIQPLYAVATRATAAGEVILKVVNGSDEAQDTELNLRGAGVVQADANAIVLTSENPADENTLDAPYKVAPITKRVTDAANKFRYTFPAQSVSVLRLQMKPAGQ